MSFDFMGRNIRTDEDILRVLRQVTNPDFDQDTESKRSWYRWSVREYQELRRSLEDPESRVSIVTFSRSVLQQRGKTVTESRVEEALTTLSPPSAEVLHLVFYMDRHLVVAEYNSLIMQTQSWRDALHEMLDTAATSLELRPGIRLEPVPRDEEILGAFRSFQRLTRLRVRLRIPNPELDRRTEQLRQDMQQSEIREYTQDMKNPMGLSQAEDALPHATVVMAQAGYKDGEVIMTGLRDGRRRTIRTGKRAARGRIDGLKGFIRGIGANAQTVEGRRIVGAILEEVDRLVEIPPLPNVDGRQNTLDDGL